MGDRQKSIYVGGLPQQVNEEVLTSIFITFGDIKYIELVTDPKGGHKGYAFIEFDEEEDATNAIDNMDESEVYGRVISVKKQQKMRPNLDKAIWLTEEYQKQYGTVTQEGEDETGTQPHDGDK
jgi:peptidyl-prolyl isomerase E (cyclophilin E)